VCEEYRIDPVTGLLGAKRPKDEPPNCERCPKLRYEDALGDERVMQAVMLSQLGVDEKTLRSDPWMYLAVRMAKAHGEYLMAQAQSKANDILEQPRGHGGSSRGRR